MTTGTKSILFGVHQSLWHPIAVWLAWIWLYRSFPDWKETFCIIIHDWGYAGKKHMDDEEGERHPELGADIAHALFDHHNWTYYDFCLCHSRHYARKLELEPSKLCYADKLSILFEFWWTYLPRAWASGELSEYRKKAADTGFIPLSASHREWFAWIKDRLRAFAQNQRPNATPYANQERRIKT